MTEETTAAKPRATKATKEPELNIYQRIVAITKEAGALAPEAKGGVPFAFRGIDGTVAHLTPFLNKYEVFLAPRVRSHIVTPNAVGNRTVKTTEVEVTYDVFGPDGKSDIEVTVPGLADDFADRSSAQAMSVAYRIALLQLFHLPTHSKEPEETGQAVLDQAGQAAPRGPKAVEAAKAPAKAAATAAPAAEAPAGGLAKLQGEAKALGKALNVGSDELNKMGSDLSGGLPPAEWFNDVAVMSSIVSQLKAKKEAA